MVGVDELVPAAVVLKLVPDHQLYHLPHFHQVADRHAIVRVLSFSLLIVWENQMVVPPGAKPPLLN